MKKAVTLASGVVQGMMLTFVVASGLHAQYTVASGMRTGGTSGVTAKYIYKPGAAVEGILGSFGNGYSLTGLIEKYAPIYYVRGLYAYHGGGIHLALYSGSDPYYRYDRYLGREVAYRKNSDMGFGINGIFGMEYRMPHNIPLAFSVDMKPFVEMGSGGRLSVAPDPSIGVKFIIR